MPALASYPDLAQQPVLVTGGASGIGADIVRAFAAQGARVALLDHDAAALAKLVAELPQLAFRQLDLCDTTALQQAVAELAQECGPFRVLINNVANDARHDWQTLTPDGFDACVAVNLRSHFFAAQAVAGSMAQAGGGAIINLGSTSWKIKGANYALYATCKSAMTGLTRSLARELGPQRIRVNTVCPGWVMTERQLALWVDAAAEQEIARNQCLPGRLHGSDIAHMALFLASDAAAMITAQEFVVDAGWT
jgi:NAD(P)-dependent dehydrogenase (short-subunit alcohol dehydrogenase family)